MSVYRVIDVIGTSTQSWEDAAVTAVNTARKSLRDLRVAGLQVAADDLTADIGRDELRRLGRAQNRTSGITIRQHPEHVLAQKSN